MYHNKPELWDVKSKIYQNRTKKQEALDQIAAKFQTTIEEMTRKIHNLRNQFNSELKKTRKKKSGQSTDEVYLSPDAKNLNVTASRFRTSIAFLNFVSCCDTRGAILFAKFSKLSNFNLTKFENCDGFNAHAFNLSIIITMAVHFLFDIFICTRETQPK
nr:unnamed protein product [Callosobruchus chinensis]